MNHILIVDDDEGLRHMNKKYFEENGFLVYEAANLEQSTLIIEECEIDCIVLDVALPDGNGFDACASVKEKRDIPIIFISNHLEEEQRISGFLSGGDDYVTKPYSLRELELRIYARIKQYKTDLVPGRILRFPPIEILSETRSVNCNNKQISFTSAEFNILYFLASNEGRVFSASEIYDRVWKQPSLGDTHTVQVHMAQTRKKMNLLRKGHNYIETIWGKGYKFNP